MGVEKAVYAESVIGTSSPAHIEEEKNPGKDTEQIENQIQEPGEFKVIRRNNKVTSFDSSKISVALTKAFLDVEGGTAAASTRVHETVDALTDQITKALTRRMPGGGTFHIEDI